MPYKNKEDARRYNAEWAMRNPERVRERGRAYDARNREARIQKCAEFRARNPDYARRKSAEWRKKNPERTKELKARWRRAHLDRHREHERRRKVAKGSVNLAAHYEKILAEATRCAYCRCKLDGEKHVDHITPLSKGGKHVPENLAVTCAQCNLSKSTKTADEFAAYCGRLFV